VAALLRKVGVLIRYFSTPVLKDYIRISVGRPSDTDALVRELETLENTWKILDVYLFVGRKEMCKISFIVKDTVQRH
jgi:hypothetical protein